MIAIEANVNIMETMYLTFIRCSSLVIDSRVSPIAKRKYNAVEALGYITLFNRVINRARFSRML